MRVPFANLAEQHKPMLEELRSVFDRVLQHSSFILGPEVYGFEQAFASYLDISHCVALNSGTAALQLTLQALEIGPGDEVITVPNTFIATAEAISSVGARPVFVDVDPLSYTMDPLLAEKAITSRTKALLPVHLYGQCADLDPLLILAQQNHIALIEDACQAHGATYRGRKAGTLGIAGCFSFYPGKNLGCLGEGGAVVTNDANLAQRIRKLRDHGSVRKYEHDLAGYNFRMEGLQAGFLSVKLKRLDYWNELRRRVAKRYSELLADSGLSLPTEMPYGQHVYHLYVVQAEERDALRRQLSTKGVETGLHYPLPLHLQKAYSSLGYNKKSFPVCEYLADHILSLPIYPELTDRNLEHVASVLRECLPAGAANNAMVAQA
jgi:dTDP-4-amino-4,6-dideoxygalactose transaminase